MPIRLLDRCQPDCIREFRAAARMRYIDGLSLAGEGRRTAAIYLWGYAAEMTLKAAYFARLGIGETDPLTWRDHLVPAINVGRAMQIYWPVPGQGHNVRAWAELLVATNAASYAPAFALEVQRQGQRIGQLWRETLRYHKNVAYLFEVQKVREATEWFLVHSEAI